MKTLVVGLALVVFLAHAIFVWMDDTALRGDIAVLPNISNSHLVRAINVANMVKRRSAQAKCEVVPGSLRIDVSATYSGQLHVESLGGKISSGPALLPVQNITIDFECTRPGFFFVPSTLSVHVDTQAMGDGEADHLTE